MDMKDNRTELQKVKSEIELKENELEKYEKKLVQLKNQEKKIRKQASLEERKKRNHRLIERGAILESFIEGASEKSNQEIKAILQKTFQKREEKQGHRIIAGSLRFSKGAIIHPKGCPCVLRSLYPCREQKRSSKDDCISPIPFFIVKGKVHSLPLTLDPKNLKRILLIKPTY